MAWPRNHDTVVNMKPLHFRSARTLGVASLSVVALSLAACGANDPSNDQGSTVYGSDSSQPSNAANASDHLGADGSGTQSGDPSQQNSKQKALASADNNGLCKTNQLEVTVTPEQGAAGTSYYNIVFENRSNKECALKGFPGVSLVKDNNGSQIGRSAQREEGIPAEAVALRPDEKAMASLGITRAELHGDACTPVQSTGIRIYPPEETLAAYVPLKATGCEGNVETLKIRPVQPYKPAPGTANAR